jgi:hypothetical protein
MDLTLKRNPQINKEGSLLTRHMIACFWPKSSNYLQKIPFLGQEGATGNTNLTMLKVGSQEIFSTEQECILRELNKI